MNANTDVDLLGTVLFCVVSTELGLNMLCALHGVDHGGKLYQEAIPRRLNDLATMFSHGLLDDLIMDGQQAQRAGFVTAHVAAEAYHVGEHDGSEFAGLGHPLRWRAVWHGGDYSAGFSHLSPGVRREGHLATCPYG